jgi:hypothetical protein
MKIGSFIVGSFGGEAQIVARAKRARTRGRKGGIWADRLDAGRVGGVEPEQSR